MITLNSNELLSLTYLRNLAAHDLEPNIFAGNAECTSGLFTQTSPLKSSKSSDETYTTDTDQKTNQLDSHINTANHNIDVSTRESLYRLNGNKQSKLSQLKYKKQTTFLKLQLHQILSEQRHYVSVCRMMSAQSAKTIGYLSQDKIFRKAIIQKGAIPALVDLLIDAVTELGYEPVCADIDRNTGEDMPATTEDSDTEICAVDNCARLSSHIFLKALPET